MKDEEMADKYAEEYVMREDVVTENDRVPFDNGYGYQTVSFEEEVKKGYKDGFLAGLKAGRPQWHNLRKDPTDLPNNELLVLCIDKVWTGQTFTTILKCCDGVFIDGNGTPYDVIAWCEIPTFDKE